MAFAAPVVEAGSLSQPQAVESLEPVVTPVESAPPSHDQALATVDDAKAGEVVEPVVADSDDPSPTSSPRRLRRSAAAPAEGAPASHDQASAPVDAAEAGDVANSLVVDSVAPSPTTSPRRRRRQPRQKGGAMSEPVRRARTYRPEERLLILEIWEGSGLPALDMAGVVGVSRHTLYAWRHQRGKRNGVAGHAAGDGNDSTASHDNGAHDDAGPASTDGAGGAGDSPPASRSSLPADVQRAILEIKSDNADWGIDRISSVLSRWHGLSVSSGAIQRVLEEAGYEVVSQPTRPHNAKGPQRFDGRGDLVCREVQREVERTDEGACAQRHALPHALIAARAR